MQLTKFLKLLCISYSVLYTNSEAQVNNLSIDFLENNEYKVSWSSELGENSETFYSIKEFPNKLNTVTNGLFGVNSVYTYIDNNSSNIVFDGIYMNNNEHLNLILRGNSNFKHNVVFNCGNNILNISNIIGSNLNSFIIKSDLKYIISNFVCHDQNVNNISLVEKINCDSNSNLRICSTYSFFKFGFNSSSNL